MKCRILFSPVAVTLLSLLLCLGVGSGCAHMLPKPDPGCLQLASTFHRLTAEKDRGTTIEEQREIVKDERTYSPVQNYLDGVLAVIYDHPDMNADQVRAQILDTCHIDSAGVVHLPPDWDPWIHSA